jgi:signal peptidase I
MENLTIKPGTPSSYNTEEEQSLPSSALVGLLKGVLEMGASFRFRANGASMTPFIKQGDLVTLSPYSGSRPRMGDVAAFFFPGTEKLAIHRVLGKKENGYLLKGDNATAIDGVIPRENILARVKKVERGEKEIRLGLRQERYLIALLARSGLLLSLFSPLCKIIRLFNR